MRAIRRHKVKSKINTSGIAKRWVPGEDDRVWLMHYSGLTRKQTDRALDGLWRLIVSRPRTKIVGFGVFRWAPWRKRIPTGEFVETWRLAFKPSRYVKKYNGEKHR